MTRQMLNLVRQQVEAKVRKLVPVHKMMIRLARSGILQKLNLLDRNYVSKHSAKDLSREVLLALWGTTEQGEKE